MGFFTTLRSAVAGAAFGFRAAFGSYSDATAASTDRGSILYYLSADTRQYVDTWTRREVLRKVEWLFQNFGVIKEATRGIARLTVGKGICLQLNTDDEEWNALAEADFEAWAMSPDRSDLAARRNFYEIQNHSVTQRIKAGEFLGAFAQNPRWDGEPCLQLFDSQELETPSDVTDDRTVDGITLDANHCPLYFNIRTNGGSRRIPAGEMIHWYYADATNQVRGISDFAQAVRPLASARELINITSTTAKQNTAIGLHIKKMVKKGGQGAIDTIRTLAQRENVAKGQAPGPGTTAPGNDPDPAYERLVGGGAIIYTDENGDAKFLTPQSPTPLLEPFITKVLMRDGLASTGAPSELFWDCANLNSANQRFVLVKGEALFVTLGDGVETRLCNPAAVRYLSHRMVTGKLRRPRVKLTTLHADGTMTDAWLEDAENVWMQHLSWQKPARLTIDNGRDAAAEISQLNSGIETLSTINDRRGRGWRPVVRQWFREFAFAARCASEAGVPWALKLWRAGVPGSNSSAPGEEDEKPQPEDAGKTDNPQ